MDAVTSPNERLDLCEKIPDGCRIGEHESVIGYGDPVGILTSQMDVIRIQVARITVDILDQGVCGDDRTSGRIGDISGHTEHVRHTASDKSQRFEDIVLIRIGIGGARHHQPIIGLVVFGLAGDGCGQAGGGQFGLQGAEGVRVEIDGRQPLGR